MLDFQQLWIITVLIIIYAVYYFYKNNDEFPGLIVLFFINTGLFRYQAVQDGKADWVAVNYQTDMFNLNDELAILTLNIFILGTLLFIIFYSLFRFVLKSNKSKNDSPQQFSDYTLRHKNKIIYGFLFFLPLNTFMTSRISGSLALGNSYFWLFGLAIGGLILLLYNAFRLVPVKSTFQKIMYLAMIAYAAYLSFNPTLRFQFLSWLIALGIFVYGKYSPLKKIRYYFIGGILILFLFALAGVARTNNLNSLTWNQKIDLALDRNDNRQDQNMLDGFMMVLDVYPKYSDFQYGMEHLAILARPIPRQLWPGKPVGGYANRLGLNDVEAGTVGISQTLYGSFYEEGGIIGIIIFCIIYGYLFARLIGYSEQYNSDIRWLIKGIIFASALPLLRGGDLPGIYAFIGMSFWPVFLFIYYYNKYVKRTN
jgi:hypothetical protein